MPAELRIDGLDLRNVQQAGDQVKATFRFDPAQLPAPAAISRLTDAMAITDLSSSEPGVEDVIRQIYTDREVAL
ncbi:hypothetical protein [Nakamurella aerolata]|uniref:Uncharacterized protein n=1 Tax=Nakamurella aerolata TaxID=1656892 RepID=A0A849ABY5_9ACTN|nr:hypothetical protein [Nakamurella aerolata]NNG34402.1 hypothetical protein [Nakamurella aerolata]